MVPESPTVVWGHGAEINMGSTITHSLDIFIGYFLMLYFIVFNVATRL